MKALNVVSLILALGLKYARADNYPNSITVGYQPLLTLGQEANVTITAPENVFYFLSVTTFSGNGSSAIWNLMSNAENESKPYNSRTPPGIDRTTNETCIARVRTETYPNSIGILNPPNSSQDGWGYMVSLDLYYSADYSYSYRKNSTNGRELVCITSPYITQSLKTERHNITVWPNGGATTTSFASTAFMNGDASYGQSFTESWPLSPPAAGQPFSSGAEGAFGMNWTVLLLFSVSSSLLLI